MGGSESFGCSLIALLFGPFAPRWAARQCARASMGGVFAAHLLALLSIPLCNILLIGLLSGIFDSMWLDTDRSPFHLVSRMVRDMLQALSDPEVWIGMGIAWIVAEAVLAAVALVLMLWRAGDEPLRESARNAFRTAWLWTIPVSAWLVLAFALLVLGSQVLIHFYTGGQGRWSGGGWNANTPLWLMHRDELLPCAGFCLAWVGALILMRAAATRVHQPTPALPPVCETCGYDLSHTNLDGRCPECGQPVRDSIAPGRRQPSPWAAARGAARIVAFLQCTILPLVRGPRFFRELAVRGHQSAARVLFLLNLALAALLGTAAAMILYWVINKHAPSGEEFYLFTMAVPGIAGGLWILLMGFGAIWALSMTKATGRNMCGPIAQIVFHFSGVHAIWVPGSLLLIAALHALSMQLPRGLFPFLKPYHFPRSDHAALAAIVIYAFLLIFLVSIHRRAFRGVLYANK